MWHSSLRIPGVATEFEEPRVEGAAAASRGWRRRRRRRWGGAAARRRVVPRQSPLLGAPAHGGMALVHRAALRDGRPVIKVP